MSKKILFYFLAGLTGFFLAVLLLWINIELAQSKEIAKEQASNKHKIGINEYQPFIASLNQKIKNKKGPIIIKGAKDKHELLSKLIEELNK